MPILINILTANIVLNSINNHFFNSKFWFWSKSYCCCRQEFINELMNTNILVLDEGPTLGFDYTTIIVEAKYATDLIRQERKIV